MPPRSSFMNAVVAIVGIEPLGARGDRPGRGGRVLERRVVVDRARTRARPWRRSSSPRPSSPTSASAWRTRCATRDRHRERVALGRIEVEHEMGHAVGTVDRARASGGTRPRAGSRTTAACAGRCTARTTPRASTPPPTAAPCGTQSGVYFGTFFCMNASWPRCTRITDSGRSSSTGMIRSRTAVEVVDEVALGRVGAVEQRLVEVGQRHPVPRLALAGAGHRERSLERGRSTPSPAPGVNEGGLTAGFAWDGVVVMLPRCNTRPTAATPNPDPGDSSRVRSESRAVARSWSARARSRRPAVTSRIRRPGATRRRGG